MELYNIYCGFWEGMKEISVGVCLNDYTWLEIWKKKKVDCSKRPSEKEKEKKWSWTKAKEKKIEVQFEIYYVKLVELMIFEKKKLCSTSL